MATKKAKKQEFPLTVYVYMDDWDENSKIPIASETPEETVDINNPVREVGIYQLIRVAVVKSSVVVEE